MNNTSIDIPPDPRREENAPNRAGTWREALEAARRGDLPLAKLIVGSVRASFPGARELLLGRCHAEAGDELEEGIALVKQAIELDPRNVLAPHVLALAELRTGHPREAAELFRRHRLPHDSSLLAQTVLTMEMMLRPWPESLPEGWPSLPESFSVPEPAPQPAEEPVFLPSTDASEPGRPGMLTQMAASATFSPVPQKPQLSRAARRRISRMIPRLERHFMEHRPVELIHGVDALFSEGLEDENLHLLAGLASEEAGDVDRGRFHLAKAQEMEPRQLIARTFLGRVYWRSGWYDLAEDLWRSLPIEGPDDYGRHYHLALAYEATGRRVEALECFQIAIRDFFMETRELYVQRAFDRWEKLTASPHASSS